MSNTKDNNGQLEKQKREPCPPSLKEFHTNCAVTGYKQFRQEPQQESDSFVRSKKKHAGWWLSQTPNTEHVTGPDCSVTVTCIQNNETLVENVDGRKEEFLLRSDEVEPPKELRWARLFGSGIGSPVAMERTQRSNMQIQRIRSVPRACWFRS